MENLRTRKHLNLDNPDDVDWLYDWAKLAQKELTGLRQQNEQKIKDAKIEILQECSEKAIEYQYGKLGGLAMNLYLQDRIKELKESE